MRSEHVYVIRPPHVQRLWISLSFERKEPTFSLDCCHTAREPPCKTSVLSQASRDNPHCQMFLPSLQGYGHQPIAALPAQSPPNEALRSWLAWRCCDSRSKCRLSN